MVHGALAAAVKTQVALFVAGQAEAVEPHGLGVQALVQRTAQPLHRLFDFTYE